MLRSAVREKEGLRYFREELAGQIDERFDVEFKKWALPVCADVALNCLVRPIFRDYALAAFLDLRFKDRYSIEIIMDSMREYERKQKRRIRMSRARPSLNANAMPHPSLMRPSTTAPMMSGMEERLTIGVVDSEIGAYLKSKCLELKEDPLQYWKVGEF
jgi:hypothetical protein